MNSRTLEYVIKIKDEASAQARSIGQSVSSSMDSAKTSSFAFAGALTVLGVTIGKTAMSGISYAGTLESLTIALETVTGSSEDAERAMARIKQVAKESPFFETESLARFVQLMIASGKATEEAVDSAVGFGDVMAAFGKGNAELTRVGNTLSQVIGKGKADIVDFKELVNAGWVSVRKDVAETMEVTMEEFEAMVSAGEIGYDQITKASEKYTGSAEKQSTTFSSLMNRMRESFQTMTAEIVEQTGLFDAVKQGLNSFIGFLDANQDKFVNFIKGGMEWFRENAPIVIGIIVGGLIPALVATAGALWALTAPILPFVAVGALIGLAIKLITDQFGGLESVIGKVSNAIIGIIDLLKGDFTPAFADAFGVDEDSDIVSYFFKIRNGIIGIVDLLRGDFTPAFAKAFGVHEDDEVMVKFFDLRNSIIDITTAIRNSFIPVFEQVWSGLQSASQAISENLAPSFSLLMESLRPLIEMALPYLEWFFVNVFQTIVTSIAIYVGMIIGLIIGLVSGFANASESIVKAISGIIEFFSGFVTLITGLINGDMNTALEGLKMMFGGAKTFIIESLRAVYKFIEGFVTGVVTFFASLYEKITGNSADAIVPSLVNRVKDWFAKLPGMVANALSGLADRITKPFRDAWDKIKGILDNIRAGLDTINPFHRESPSLVDNVIAGVAEIKKQYASLADISVPSINQEFAPALAGVGGGQFASQTNYTTQAPISLTAVINNETDAVALAKMLGLEIETRGRF